MNEHQRETAFLRQIIRYDDTVARHCLEAKMTEVERNERCVRRAVLLMALLAGLAAAGLCYSIIFLGDFPENKSQLILKVFGGLGLGSLICLPVFVGYWMVHRRALDVQRGECRRLIIKLLESRLGAPHPPLRPKSSGRVIETGKVIPSAGTT